MDRNTSGSKKSKNYPWAINDNHPDTDDRSAVHPRDKRKPRVLHTARQAAHPYQDVLNDGSKRFSQTKARSKRKPVASDDDDSKYGAKAAKRKHTAETSAKPTSFFRKLLQPVDQASGKTRPASTITKPSRPAKNSVNRNPDNLLNGKSVQSHYARVSHHASKRSTVSVLSESTESLPATSRALHVDTDSGDESDTEVEELPSQEPSIPNRPAQKNGAVGFKLPRLTSSLEKDVLGGIFSQWEQEAAGDVKEKDAVKNPRDGLQVHMNGIPPVKPGIPVDNKAGDAAPRPKNSLPVAPASAQPAGILRNSSSSAFLCLDTIMASLPDNAGAWSISSYDKMREKGVYLQTRDSRERPKICCRCGERTSSKHHRCPQIVCGVCHSYDHWQHACPFQTTVSTLTCKRCQSVGHLDIVCTDTWRQYHTTITPNCGFIMSTTKKKTLHCCNCAVPGHLYHECRRKRYNKYAVSSPNVFVKRYDAGENSKKRHPPRDVESPMEKFSRMVCDMMSEEDSELMSATYDHKKSSRKRMRGGSSLLSSPNKRKRKGHR